MTIDHARIHGTPFVRRTNPSVSLARHPTASRKYDYACTTSRFELFFFFPKHKLRSGLKIAPKDDKSILADQSPDDRLSLVRLPTAFGLADYEELRRYHPGATSKHDTPIILPLAERRDDDADSLPLHLGLLRQIQRSLCRVFVGACVRARSNGYRAWELGGARGQSASLPPQQRQLEPPTVASSRSESPTTTSSQSESPTATSSQSESPTTTTRHSGSPTTNDEQVVGKS